jgi:hypothetical protein
MVAILSGAANVTTLADSPAMQKLVANIMVTIGQAKAIDEEKRELPPVQQPQPLLPPRPKDYVARPPSKERRHETFKFPLAVRLSGYHFRPADCRKRA